MVTPRGLKALAALTRTSTADRPRSPSPSDWRRGLDAAVQRGGAFLGFTSQGKPGPANACARTLIPSSSRQPPHGKLDIKLGTVGSQSWLVLIIDDVITSEGAGATGKTNVFVPVMVPECHGGAAHPGFPFVWKASEQVPPI